MVGGWRDGCGGWERNGSRLERDWLGGGRGTGEEAGRGMGRRAGEEWFRRLGEEWLAAAERGRSG